MYYTLIMSTDKDWEIWGANNPYFGVLSHPKFLGSKLRADVEQDFYASGQADIDQVVSRVRLLGGSGRFACAVDFGCGTGRLTIPLADHASRVVGLDVSPSVLHEAKKKTPQKLAGKITYDLADDQLKHLPKKYDLVHSYIVFQHIPTKRGEAIISKLLTELQPGGFAALHVTFTYRASKLKKVVIWLRNHFVPLHYVLNICRHRPWNTPRMRMYTYNLDNMVRIFGQAGIPETVQIMTDHGGYLGLMIIGRKQ